MKKIVFAIIALIISDVGKAQHQEINEKPEMYKGKKHETEDTISLLSAFKRGHFNGHFRYYFMSTQNQKGLTDYYAHAVGGGLRFETAIFHGFQFAVSGFYSFNIGSPDLGKPDSTTGQMNRYEIGLFDVENPYNKNDIDRLEELRIKYKYKSSNITFGKQLINTPFINLQDGRMRPTGVEGFWLELNEIKNLKIESGWLFSMSPRATTKFYSAGGSIGLYPTGVNIDGSKSGYKENLKSKGIFLLGSHLSIGEKIKLHGWDVFTENIFNTAMLQADVIFPLKGKNAVFASAQFIRQDAVKSGGNEDVSKAFFEKGGKSMTFGAKAGWKNKQWETNINYNRITAEGRYLMPREWGREPFFTFLPRERNEGFGDVHAFMGKVYCDMAKIRLKASLAGGYFKMPDVKNYRLNKYGLPSYVQLNADARYAFNNFLNGLEAQFLVVGKWRTGETYNNKKYEFNKVNMMLFNFIINYHF
jgi:hypothetical protein